MTALFSTLLIVLIQFFNPQLFAEGLSTSSPRTEWLELGVWGGTLVVTGYFMGTLYEHRNAQIKELGQTYNGILLILRHFISKDKYTENHCYRVSVYAAKIAAHMGLATARIEDVRAAALLHDIGKLDVSREILHKAARLTDDEFTEMKGHVNKGVNMLEPVGGTLHRILPIILAHHDKFDGSGYNPTKGQDIPLEARIITVADVYDSLSSDRPYRKAMPPPEGPQHPRGRRRHRVRPHGRRRLPGRLPARRDGGPVRAGLVGFRAGHPVWRRCFGNQPVVKPRRVPGLSRRAVCLYDDVYTVCTAAPG